MNYHFQKHILNNEDWELIENSHDYTLYFSRQWTDYLSKSGYKPLCISVSNNLKQIGFFIGVKVGKIWPFSIISAPMNGSATFSQGLCLFNEVSEEERISIYSALSMWAFEKRIATYIQVTDMQMARDSKEYVPKESWHFELLDKLKIDYETKYTLSIDLNKPIEDLWTNLAYKSCKYCINKANKNGLRTKIINKSEEIEEFTRIHYKQLVDVCDRHGMRPKHSQCRRRMLGLCQSLFPDKVIMMEVIGNDSNGKDIIMSSAIFCLDKGESAYWTGASNRQYMKSCPNEFMVWEAIKMLKNLNAGTLNLLDTNPYKLKFGPTYTYVPNMAFSQYKFLFDLKKKAIVIYRKIRYFIITKTVFHKNEYPT